MCLYVRHQQLKIIIYVSYAHVLGCIQLFVTLWTVAYQVPLSMEFSRQEYWSRLPFPIPGYLPHPRIKPKSLVSSALAGRFFPTDNTQEVTITYIWLYINLTETKKPKIYNRYRIETEKRKESRQNTKSSLQITREETKENNPKTINKMTQVHTFQ